MRAPEGRAARRVRTAAAAGGARALRVAYVTMAFPKDSETFACAELRALRRRGIETRVHALLPAAAYAREMLAAHDLSQLDVDHASLRSMGGALRAAVRHPRAAFSLCARIVSECAGRPRELLRSLALAPRALEIFAALLRDPPDAVHLYWGHYPALVGHLVQRFAPHIATSSFLGAYDLLLDYPPAHAVAARADFTRTLARVNVPVLEARGIARERIVMSHHGIDLTHLPAGAVAGQARAGAQPPAPRRRAHVVSAARLIRAKRIDLVLRCFARIRAERPEATLEVLGDGPERARLQALATRLGIADAVSWRGHVGQQALFAALARAELFVLLSQHPAERLPNVVKEAMACGCPCVVSRTPGIEELVEHERSGFVVEAEDLDAAAAASLRALEAGPRRDAMCAAAARHVREHFDVDRSVGPLVAGWQAAAARRRAAEGCARPEPARSPA